MNTMLKYVQIVILVLMLIQFSRIATVLMASYDDEYMGIRLVEVVTFVDRD